MLLRDHIASARSAFITAGIDAVEAGLDARLLAASVLGYDSATLLIEFDAPAPMSFESAFHALVARRTMREPMAYVLGRQEFWGLSFVVTPAVLIPRPETELIVETVCARIAATATPFDVADVGTGSGCLAVALAMERPRAHVTGVDMSLDALAVAAQNVAAHRVGDRVRLVRADLLEDTLGPFDLIVSNPPYVPVADAARLQPEVREHEPRAALFADDDGLGVIRRLVPQAASRLKPGGWLVFEIGFGQADRVRAIVSHVPQLSLETIYPDLQGIPRAVVARRR